MSRCTSLPRPRDNGAGRTKRTGSRRPQYFKTSVTFHGTRKFEEMEATGSRFGKFGWCNGAGEMGETHKSTAGVTH